MADEADRFKILSTAMDIGGPLALLAAVIAVEHGGDSIDAQPVDVKMLQPIERGGNQEALHFAPSEIVDEGVPILMKSFTRIEMLVERGAVETREAVRIGWKVRRHPV